MIKNENNSVTRENKDGNTPLNKTKTGIMPWVWLILALVYTFSPIDLVPDAFPLLGWLDDIALIGVATLNIFEKYNQETHKKVATILKYLKWILLLLVLVFLTLLSILGYFMFYK